jgi:hypothetical protein
MTNEQIIRGAYDAAKKVDLKDWVDCFTPTGTFTDMSIGVMCQGPDGPKDLQGRSRSIRRRSATCTGSCTRSSPWVTSSSFELVLQGTHKGPLPTGTE